MRWRKFIFIHRKREKRGVFTNMKLRGSFIEYEKKLADAKDLL